jgi:hypothetical protein
MRGFNLLVAAFALLQCARYARRALLFMAPTLRVWGEPGAAPRSARRLRAGAALEALGFASLGIQHERAPLGALEVEGDVYASPQRAAFADVLDDGAAGPRVRFFTPFTGGAAVVTAAFQRPAVASARILAGGMPEAPLEAVLAAHEVAVARFRALHGSPDVSLDLESRLAAARTWARGQGRRELRRAHAPAFVIVFFGAVVFASAARVLLR